MNPWKLAAGLVAIAVVAGGLPAHAASLISTSTTSSAFDSASRFHVHHVGGYYWVAFHNGTTPVLFSSADGVNWASQGSIFTFNPAIGGMWTTRFLGTTVVALGFNSGNSNRYYRNGTLNADGTVSWAAETVAQAAATATSINASITNQKPVYWRASAPGAGQLARGSAFVGPTWQNPPLAPTLAPTSGGRFWAGAIFPTGGSNPEDLILVRATTQAPYAAGNHRLVSLRYDQLLDSNDAAWYNVSTLGGGLAESAITEVQEAADDVAQLRLAAVRDTTGNVHAVYVNRNDDVVHYRKDVGFAGIWSRISTDVTQTASLIDRVALTAAGANNLFLFYSKSDNGIYYRRFNGASWGGENVLKTADANQLRGALAAMEAANGCSIGLAWEEGAGSPYNVLFSLGIGSCGDLSTSAGAGTLTVTAPASFEMRFNTATGGGIDQFYDLAEDPTRTYDLAGGPNDFKTLHSLEIAPNATGLNHSLDDNNLGAKAELLEVTSTRVRVRQDAFFQRGAATLAGLKAIGDYSVYGTGRTALRWTETDSNSPAFQYARRRLELNAHYTSAGPLSNYTPCYQGNPACWSSGGGGSQADFLLGVRNVPNAWTDFLTILSKDWAQATTVEYPNDPTVGNEWLAQYWEHVGLGSSLPSESWDLLTHFKPTDLGNTGNPWQDSKVTLRSTDYRTPDPLSAIGPGSGWNENPADADFFNESEAAYTLDLNPSTGLMFDMDGSTRRYSPFFKIRQWRSLTPPATITVASVTNVRDIDFKADVKPVSRAAFAKDLLWHSTLQVALAVTTNVDIGSPGVSNGVAYVAARYGQGANVTANNQYIAFPTTDGAGALTGDFDAAKGAVEFWYKPSWNHDDFVQHDLGGVYIDPTAHFLLQKLTTNDLRFRIAILGTNYDCTVTSANYNWRANDWVHLRFEWDDSPVSGPEQRIVINEAVPTQTCPGNWTSAGVLPPNTEFRLGDIGDGAGTFGAGLYDEFYSFGTSSTTPTSLANGGLTSSANEYLGNGAQNFPLTFVTRDSSFRGPRFFVGSDSKFLGLNIALTVKGLSPDANLRIHYWNGTAWSYLSDTDSAFWVPGFSDTTNSLRQDGTMSWPESLVPNWAPYSVNGGPDLYYIRIGQQYGTYTTPPTEGVIKTDILLFQYCTDVTLAAQTFVFPVPLPTAVELVSFEARGLEAAAELAWRTASELKNLGFHLYRATSPEGPYSRITPSPIPGLGSSPSGASYQYTDTGLKNGATYYYKLEDIETTGKTKLHGPISVTPVAGAVEPKKTSSSAAMTYGEPASSSLRVLARSRREIVVELTTGGFRAEPQADGSVRLSIPGFWEESEPGSPSLPVKRSWIPLEGARAVEVASVRAEDVDVFSSLRPMAADSPELIASARGTVRAGRRSHREGKAFREAGLYPDEAARVIEVGFQGDEKKAKVELSPLRFNRSTGELLLARRLVVRLKLSGREPSERQRGRVPAVRDVAQRLWVREPGLYGVSYEKLFGASRRRGSSYSSVRLSRLGEAVPFHIEPVGAQFGPGTTLYFVSGGASLNPYGNEAAYELELKGNGTRIPVVSSSLSGSAVSFYWHEVSREENRYYQAGLVDADDHWLWDVLLAPVAKSYPFEVSALAPTGQPSLLSVRLQGTSDLPESPDHHVRIAVNGTPLFESTFEGKNALRFTAEIPPGVLREGLNDLSIENVGDTGAAYSMVMLDRFSVSYPRRLVAEAGLLKGTFSESGVAEVDGLEGSAFVLDVSDETPRWLRAGARIPVEAGRRYQVVSPRAVLEAGVETASKSDLKSLRNEADYLVLAPRALLQEAKLLLELRDSQGLRTRGVAIEDVYSEFGFGESRPEAIREFLSYAYRNWQEPAPRYVLLLGDATYDFKDYLETGVRNQVPPSMVKTSYLWTASDSSYAAIHGDDELPDLAIGRLPARNAEEARAMVAKILAYETTGAITEGPVVLVADNPDAAGNFEADAEQLASGLLSSRNPRKIFLGQMGTASTQTAIVDVFDQGASLLSYVGHGGIHLWASENVFDTSRVASLAPTPQQPFVLTLNCLNGYFHFPFFDSLAEALVKAEGKGAIAAFSPSGLSLNEPAQLFHKALLEELLSGRHDRLGDAVLAAQVTYADSGAFPELLRIYLLLGDPALTLR